MSPKKNQQVSKKPTKLMHSLASPFPELAWPEIQTQCQETILELFCELLRPLGQHQRNVSRSKGKRKQREEKKRRKHEETGMAMEPLPKPDIASYVTIGFNSTHRLLEDLVQKNAPAIELDGPSESVKTKFDNLSSLDDKLIGKDADMIVLNNPQPEIPIASRLAVVLVERSSQPSVMIQHLPTMMAAAASSLGAQSPIWLVTLPNGSEDKLRQVMEIPRIGLFGLLENAPGSKPLLDYIKASILPVQPLNLSVGLSSSFRPLHVETKVVESQPSRAKGRIGMKVAVAQASTADPDVSKQHLDGVNKPFPKRQRR